MLGACGGTLEGAGPDGGAAPRDGETVTPDAASGPDLDAGLGDAGGRDAGATEALPLASDLELSGIAAFQGVKVVLAEGGAEVVTRSAPVVAEREVLFRLYVATRAGFVPRALRGEVVLHEGGRVVAVHGTEQRITGTSTDDAPSSCIDVRVPAVEITETATLTARVVEPSGRAGAGPSDAAVLPRSGGPLALRAQSDRGGLELVLVPFVWDSDGSHRMPDTSEAQLARIRALLLALYPLAHLELRVRAPVPYPGGLTFRGNVDFGDVNARLLDLRASDGASDRAYYYALVQPAETYDAYCGGSCVTGQSYVVDAPDGAAFRVGSGVGFPGEDSAWTLAHEVGHEHGRYHAPCDAGGPDADYPYTGGGIGGWGWDARSGAFLDPSSVTDFMGYCEPTWISDYTWQALFERTVAVRALSASADRVRPLIRLRVSPEGVRWEGAIRAAPPTTRSAATLAWLDARGAVLGLERAPALALSHGEDHLVLGTPPEGAEAVRVSLGALVHTVRVPH